jgi:lipid-A-disaccharide synthase
MAPYDLFIFAGEPSGDLHGEALIRDLKKRHPSIKIIAVAGPRMRALGIDCILPMEKFQVMGFIDVFTALPRLIKQFYFIAEKILTQKPKVALFIDYPGFNLRLEKHLKKKKFSGKMIHYICPTVWVHGKGRIDTMEQSLDELLCILPFEKECFLHSPLKVTYVGHPLISRIDEHIYKPIPSLENKKVIAFFPGSRTKEILRNFPIYLQLMKKWATLHPEMQFAISISRDEHKNLINEMIEKKNLQEKTICIPTEQTYDLMKTAHLAIAKSGTVTLELALHKVPTVVTYAATKLDIFIARDILGISLPYYSLASILCKEKVYPELIGPNFTLENLEKEAENLLQEKELNRCRALCEKPALILGKQKASQETAIHVAKALNLE